MRNPGRSFRRFFSVMVPVGLTVQTLAAPGIHASSPDLLRLLSEPRAMSRLFDPIEVQGRYLLPFLGQSLDGLTLFAAIGGRPQVVRFQIDERTDKLEMMLTQGEERRRVLGNGVLDPQDLLVFMVSSAGERARPEALALVAGAAPERAAQGALDRSAETAARPAARAAVETPSTAILEIEISDPLTGEKGYVYLARNPRNLLPAAEMPPFGLEGGEGGGPFVVRSGSFLVQGRVNRSGRKIYQSPVYERWVPLEQAGGCGYNLFDSMKVRIRGRALFGALSISVDETSVIGGVEATRVGPVRGYGRYWMRAFLPLKLKSPKATMDVYAYDFGVLVPGQFGVPFNPGYVITDFQVTIGYDLSKDAMGMMFYNSNNPEGFLIDGRMSEAEKRMDTGIDEWRAVVGPQGAMITASVWDPGYREQAEISVRYLDDREHASPPENEPGSVGFHCNSSKVRSLRHGRYDMLLCWLYPPAPYDIEHFFRETVPGFINLRKHPLRIRIGDQEFDNPGGWPPLIKPAHPAGAQSSRDTAE